MDLINDNSCGWTNQLPERSNIKLLDQDIYCDYLIVGAGYTGLSAARKLSEVKKDKHIKMNVEDEKLFGIDKLNIKRSSIPAITHVDYSARIQTVHKETNPRYYDLINEFKKNTNCPVLVNTSFNVRGEPIVCSIDDAFNCFMGTNLDILVIENFLLFKEDQDKSLLKDYKNKFELD